MGLERMSEIRESLTEYIQKVVDSPIVREAYSIAQRLGMTLEKFVVMVLSMFYPSKDGYRIEHEDWNNYTAHMGTSTDIRLFLRNKLIAVFECKNWRILPEHRYGLEAVKREIVSRFNNCGTNLKVLIISFREQLSKRALSFLESNNIQIIETGKLIGKKDFRSKLIYQLGKQIKQFIRAFKPTIKPSNQLFSNQVSSSNVNTVSHSDSDKQNDSDCTVNPLVAWIFEQSKPMEPIKTRWKDVLFNV